MSLFSYLSDALWNPWLLGLFLLTGLIYSLGSGFFQFFRVKLWLTATLGALFRPSHGESKGGLSSIQALATALASTIGTGSIAGVSTAILLGGPGAIFWMWVSALLGMMTGCGEKLLAVKYQRRSGDGGLQGGPMYYLRDGVGSPFLSGWFALACIPATLVGGNLVQSSSISSALHTAFGFDPIAVGLVTAVAAGLVMVGGVGRIARFSTALVPAMALLYLGSGLLVLIAQAQAIPSAIHLIFSCALSPKAALGGGMGYTFTTALRYGVSRGVFTNEAGLGTSAMAHGAAQVDHPARQGMWGIFEVFVSTILVCSITGLVILVGGVYTLPTASTLLEQGLLGAPLTAASFSSVMGSGGNFVVAFSLLLFAFSSILGWSYYGQQALGYLTGGTRFLPAFRVVFLLCTVLGAVVDTELIWQLVDLCNAMMAFPNLTALLLLAPEALACLREWEQS